MANTLNGFKVIGDTSMIGAGVKHGGAGQTSTAPSANGENRTLNGFKVVGDTSKIGAKSSFNTTTQQTTTPSAATTKASTSKNQWVSTGGGRKSTTDAGKRQGFVADPTRAKNNASSRIKNIVTGATKSAGSAFTNLGGVLAEGAGHLNTRIANNNAAGEQMGAIQAIKDYNTMLRNGKWADGKALTADDRKKIRTYIAANQRKVDAHKNYTRSVEKSDKAVADKAYQKADQLSQSSAADVAQAKEGLGPVGQFAVDLGVQGVQMAGDVAASAVIPGAGLALMTARSAGSSAQRARQAGATYGQQLAYGLGSGALSLATEKISNVASPFKKAFGGGVLDNAISGALSKLNNSAAGRVALSMISEGGEEFIEDIFQPVLQRATYDPSARFDLSDALYDAAVGAAMGGIGAGVDVIRQRGNGQTDAQPTQEARPEVREGTYTPTPANAAEGTQNAAPGVETAENIRVGQATTIKKPYKGEVPTQTQRQNTAPVQVSSDAMTQAQNSIAGARELESSFPGQSFKSTLKNVYKSIFKPATGVVVEGTSFGGQPYAVDIPNSVPGKVISDTNLTAEKLALLDNLPDVVRNGTYVGSGEYVPHGSKAKKTVRFDYFEAPVEINGKQYIASFDVEAFPDVNNYRTHKLNEIELSPMTNADTGRDPAANAMRTVPVEGTRPLNANDSIAQGAKNVKSDPLMDILFGKQGAEKVTDTPGDARYDNLGSARQGFTTPGMEGTERTSRFAESMPYNQWQEAATGLSREDYARIFRYESQTEAKSMHLAEELVYVMKDGKKTFLRDVDEGAFHELVKSLDDATAWNGPQTDAARMIQSELQGKSVDAEIPDTEYTDFLKIMREHETSTGQGVQANAKWSRKDNNGGQASELDAWNNLERSSLSDAEKTETFRQIVKWDTDIEAVKPGDTAAMKDIILDVANERGVLGGATRKIANKALDSLTFDQLKQFAYASTSAMSTDATPANAGRKAKTIQILSMLSNLKTPSKNIVGNTSFYLLDALSMKGGALLDTAVSKFTGTRSVANEKALSREAIHSAMKAANMSIAEIALDVDMSGDRSRYGTGSQRTFKMNGEGVFNTGTKVDKFGERVLSTLERNQAYLLNATDEFFKGAARNVEGNIQKLVDEGKIKTTDKNYAKNQAEQLARYRTFQDNSKLSVVIQEVHDALNLWGFGDSGRKRNGRTIHSFGAGDIVAPFIRVAGNLVSRGAEYSPYNVIKGTGEIVGAAAKAAGGNTDVSLQAKGVSDFARGMTGTMVAAGFMAIAKMGLLRKADDEDNENVAALNRSEGMTGTQFNWSAFQRMLSGGDTQWQNGDTLIDVSSIEPLNLLADLGAEMAKSDENPVISSFKATPKSLVDASSSLPVVQFLGDVGTDILKYGNDPIESISKEAASTLAASVVPNALRATAQGLDDRPRSTGYADTFTERLAMEAKSRIPGLRETLPGSVDTLGNERTYQGTTPERLFNSMLNPVGVNHYQQGELSKDLESLRERSGGNASFYPTNRIPKEISYTDKGGKKHTAQMDYEQRQDFQRKRGTATSGTMVAMTGTRAYQKAKPERQVALMSKCRDYGYEVAKGSVLGKASMESWAVNAQTSKKDVGLSTVEFLALYTDDRYKSYLSGKAYEKTKEAYRAGVSVEEYVGLKESADTNGNGTISKAEASAALAGQENRADLWDIICTTNAKNPYK